MFIGLSAPRDLPWRVSHKGKRMTTRRYGKPTSLGDVLRGYLAKAGLGRRLAQAQVIPDWPRLVGPQIAAVTQPESVTPDGTLFVRVATSAWMRSEEHTSELQSLAYLVCRLLLEKKKNKTCAPRLYCATR